MAIRIRKLAKSWGRSSKEIIGLLHALGFNRYRSEQDMLPDAAVDRIKRADKEGVKPVFVSVASKKAVVKAAPAVRPVEEPMRRLMSGVRRAEVLSAPVASPSRPIPVSAPLPTPESVLPFIPASQPAVHAPSRLSVVEGALAQITIERMKLTEERDEAGRQNRLLKQVIERLRTENLQLLQSNDVLRARAEKATRTVAQQAERSLTAAAVVEVAAVAVPVVEVAAVAAPVVEASASGPSAPPKGVSLVDVLFERGLRGPDEQGRAWTALIKAHKAGEFFSGLSVVDPVAFLASLREELVLMSGAPPEEWEGSVPSVRVAKERAEAPSGKEARRLVQTLYAKLLLNGWRRVLWVGGTPKYLRLLRAWEDHRVESFFFQSADSVPTDFLQNCDVVFAWSPDGTVPQLPQAENQLVSHQAGFGGFLSDILDYFKSLDEG